MYLYVSLLHHIDHYYIILMCYEFEENQTMWENCMYIYYNHLKKRKVRLDGLDIRFCFRPRNFKVMDHS